MMVVYVDCCLLVFIDVGFCCWLFCLSVVPCSGRYITTVMVMSVVLGVWVVGGREGGRRGECGWWGEGREGGGVSVGGGGEGGWEEG